jgi:hypothetical protein
MGHLWAVVVLSTLSFNTSSQAKDFVFLPPQQATSFSAPPQLLAKEPPAMAQLSASAKKPSWSLFTRVSRGPASISPVKPMHETDPARKLLPYGPADLRPILLW